MNKTSAFAAIAATIVAVLATAVPALADPQPLEQLEHQSSVGAHYLTYTGSTEQASNQGVRYLTSTGDTEQVKPELRTQSGAPEGMTEQQWKAELFRAQALNKKYHLGGYASTEPKPTQWENDLLKAAAVDKGSGVPATKADVIAEMNQRYHLGTYAPPAAAESQAALTAEMNQRYHLGTYAPPASVAAELRGLALNSKYGNAWTRMPTSQYNALVRFFGNDVTQHSPNQLKTFVLQGEKGTTLSAPSGSGFGW